LIGSPKIMVFGCVIMGKYRESVDIVADVLKAAGEGTSKTRIMYGANLSFRLLERYLELSMANGFLQQDQSKYRVTANGRSYIERYNRYVSQFSKVQGMVSTLHGEREALNRLFVKVEQIVKPKLARKLETTEVL
jgi:predicted transcriptional regulator